MGELLIGFGAGNVLVEFGRVDGRQKLALLHLSTNIDVPPAQKTTGSGIEGRLAVWLNLAGERQARGIGGLFERHGVDDGIAAFLGVGFCLELIGVTHSGQHARKNEQRNQQQQRNKDLEKLHALLLDYFFDVYHRVFVDWPVYVRKPFAVGRFVVPEVMRQFGRVDVEQQ